MLTTEKILADINRYCINTTWIDENIKPYHLKLDQDVLRLLYIMKCQDFNTYIHSLDVSNLVAKSLCNKGHSKPYIADLITAGIVHDVGKLMISQSILSKPTKLTKEEFIKVKEHPVIGYELIKDNKRLPNIAKLAVLLHHERLDGSGYPKGITSSNLGEVNLIAVCDVMQALLSRRPYKKSYSISKAVELAKLQSLDIEYIDELGKILKEGDADDEYNLTEVQERV